MILKIGGIVRVMGTTSFLTPRPRVTFAFCCYIRQPHNVSYDKLSSYCPYFPLLISSAIKPYYVKSIMVMSAAHQSRRLPRQSHTTIAFPVPAALRGRVDQLFHRALCEVQTVGFLGFRCLSHFVEGSLSRMARKAPWLLRGHF
jgi:hypothetical protein